MGVWALVSLRWPMHEHGQRPGEEVDASTVRKPTAVDIRRAGMLLAVAVGVFLVVVFTLVLVARKYAGGLAKGPAGPAINLPSVGGNEPAPTIGEASPGASTGQARVRFMDKADPGREASRLEWEKLQPGADGQALVERPRGFIYLKDGSMAVISAKQGTFYTPKGRSEPESGRFEGGVKVELFDAVQGRPGEPARGIDIQNDVPTIIATTRTLLFNAPESEMSTTDAFVIETDKLSITGAGALVVFDQVEEGISRAEFAKVDDVRIWPAGRPGLKPSTTARSLAGPGGGRDGAGQVKVESRRVYRLVLDEDVSLLQGLRKLLAARVEAWVTLVNNQLPDGAIGAFGRVDASGQSGAAAAGGEPSVAENQVIIASWKGRAVLTPARATPDEMAGNLVALRLMGGAGGPVRVIDGPAKLAGEAPIVEYGATTRTLAMRGSTGRNVVLTAGGTGTLVCGSVKADLTTGIVQIDGSGEIDSAKADGGPAFSATWSEAFRLRLKQENGSIEPWPLSAMARGNVQARSGDVVATGQMAELEFAPPAQGQTRSALRQLVLTGAAKVVTPRTDGQPGSDEVAGNVLTLSMKPGPLGSEVAERVVVRGGARAAVRTLLIKAEEFAADLGIDANGRTTAGKMVATGKPTVSDASGLEASADRIEADATAGTAELTGQPVVIRRDGATMTGTTVRLVQREQTALVQGPGRITAESADNARPSKLQASWQTGARFDGKAGRIEAEGQIEAEIRVGADEVNTARGQRLVLLLDMTEQAKAPVPASSVAGGGANTQIKSVEISAGSAAGAPPAQFQHRTFAASGNQGTPARMVYLQGATIAASVQNGTLTVDGPGKLLVDDRSSTPAQAPAPGAGPLANLAGGKGRSLFAWGGSMQMNRATGQMKMQGQVQLTHRPAGVAGSEAATDPSAGQVLLDCNELQATLRGVDAAAGGALKADLSRVEALGSVRAASEGRELLAERLMFDAQAELMQAVGTDEQLVTFVDPAQPAPVRARFIEWNLREKRINTEGVAPIMIVPK